SGTDFCPEFIDGWFEKDKFPKRFFDGGVQRRKLAGGNTGTQAGLNSGIETDRDRHPATLTWLAAGRHALQTANGSFHEEFHGHYASPAQDRQAGGRLAS